MSAEIQGRPTLVLLAGPNGAGKTTLYETRIAPKLKVPFVNADLIQRDELRDPRLTAAYDAACLADERREALLRSRKSFATETVFSHPSKLEIIDRARAAGYRILTFHIALEDPSLAVARVADRAEQGGHNVPEDKIRARFQRNGPLIRQAVLKSDVAHVFDNSALNRPPKHILSFIRGRVSFAVPYLPGWAADLYAEDLTI